MCFCIRKKNQRGSAITETLLLLGPAVIFFYLILFVLDFWQDEQIDRSEKLVSLVARFNNATLIFNGGTESMIESPSITDKPAVYWEDKSAEFVANKKNPPRRYYIYMSDYVSTNRYRRLLLARSMSCWLSFPYMRGQYSQEEGAAIQQWFEEEAGNKKLNDLRQALQLGS